MNSITGDFMLDASCMQLINNVIQRLELHQADQDMMHKCYDDFCTAVKQDTKLESKVVTLKHGFLNKRRKI